MSVISIGRMLTGSAERSTHETTYSGQQSLIDLGARAAGSERSGSAGRGLPLALATSKTTSGSPYSMNKNMNHRTNSSSLVTAHPADDRHETA